MTRYAEKTSVSSEKSRAEIERLKRHAADLDARLGKVPCRDNRCVEMAEARARIAELERIRCPDGVAHRWNGDGQCKECSNYATDLIDAALAKEGE